MRESEAVLENQANVEKFWYAGTTHRGFRDRRLDLTEMAFI